MPKKKPDKDSKKPCKRRLLAVDPHPIGELGLRNLLFDWEVTWAGDFEEGLGLATAERWDLVLLELNIGGPGAGMPILGDILEFRGRPVLIYTHAEEIIYMARARALGALGWVRKSQPLGDLIGATERCYRRENIWTREQLKRLDTADTMALDVYLTPRERDVVKQIAMGLKGAEIAVVLGVSRETLRSAVKNINKKLGLTRSQLIVWAIKKGF